jgi:hypothetical protein
VYIAKLGHFVFADDPHKFGKTTKRRIHSLPLSPTIIT